MVLQLPKKHTGLLRVIIIFIVLVMTLKCFVYPVYTKKLFEPIANECYFPEYFSSDIAYIEQLYSNLYFDYYDNDELIMFNFALDFSTNVYLAIYNTQLECENAFWYYVNDYSSGFMLENTDKFKIFVSKKDFSILNLETEQCLFAMNGTTLYSISKYSFSFSQKDFKNSVLLLDNKHKTNTHFH